MHCSGYYDWIPSTMGCTRYTGTTRGLILIPHSHTSLSCAFSAPTYPYPYPPLTTQSAVHTHNIPLHTDSGVIHGQYHYTAQLLELDSCRPQGLGGLSPAMSHIQTPAKVEVWKQELAGHPLQATLCRDLAQGSGLGSDTSPAVCARRLGI